MGSSTFGWKGVGGGTGLEGAAGVDAVTNARRRAEETDIPGGRKRVTSCATRLPPNFDGSRRADVIDNRCS